LTYFCYWVIGLSSFSTLRTDLTQLKMALRSVAPPAAGRLLAEQAIKRADCWSWLTVSPMAGRL